MKTLTREKGQRMWGGGEGGSGGGGGMNVNQLENMLSGYASQDWVDQNYLSIEFFARLFKAYGPGEDEGDPDVEVVPNDLESTITNIKAMVGLWTEEYLSAMGLDPTEGGGGLSLNEPLASINNAGLASHPSSSGQTIIWNGSSWAYGTTGSGSVTYVGLVAPAGFNVTGSPVTSMGTLTLTYASGYSLPLTADVTKGVTAYGWGDHSQAGYALASNVYSKTDADGRFLTISFFRSLFRAYTSGDVEVQPNSGNTATIDNIKAMFGFWTEQYISAMGQDTSGGGISLNEPLASINSAGLSSHPSSAGQTIVWNGSAWVYGTAGGASALYALSDVNVSGVTIGQYLKFNGLKWVPDTPGLGDYLPLSGGTLTGSLFTGSNAYVVIGASTGEQGKNLYVSGNAKVTGDLYIGNNAAATQSWVTSQGYVTSSGVTSITAGTGLSGGTITGSGTISLTSSIQTKIDNGDTAYSNLQYYMLKTGGTFTGDVSIQGKLTLTGSVYCGGYILASQSWVTSNFMGLTSGIANCTGIKLNSVCIESNSDGTGIGSYTGEINRFTNTLHLQYSSTYAISMCYGGGSVLIGTTSGQQGAKLYVSGNAVITGSCTAASHPTSSDMRMKDIVKYIDMKLEDIAAAPSFLYRWKNSQDMKVYAGSSAQYWQLALPQVVWEAQDQMRSLSLSYDVAALISTIAVAKRVVNHEERIKQLEAENEALRQEIEDLKAGDLQTE